MLTNILLALGILVALVLIYAATRPDTFRIERSVRMKAAPDKIFPHLVDFHNWSAWSPWEKLDPAMTRTYSGAASGVGAVYAWEGNKKVGKGRMEITDTTPSSRMVIKLDFLAPWEAHNSTIYTLAASGGETTVTCAMEGKNQFMGKVMGLFMNMDKMIGADFEKGLANMKALVER